MPTKSTYTSALSPEYALLGLLWQRPAHGYELHQRLASELEQVWHISLSQTYNILNRLEKHGFINSTPQAQEKLPDRRQLHLTESGRQRFETWLYTPSGCSVRAIRVEFTTRLYFAHAKDLDLAYRLIGNQTAEVEAGMERLKVKLIDTSPEKLFNRLGLELRIRQLESIIEWLADCKREIEAQEINWKDNKVNQGAHHVS